MIPGDSMAQQAAFVKANAFKYYLYDNHRKSFLELKHAMTCGRFQGDFTFPGDDLLSRKHCQFTIQGNEIYVEDLGSTNPTRINSAKIHPLRKRRIRINDVIEIGQQRFILTSQNKHAPSYIEDLPAQASPRLGVLKEDGSFTLKSQRVESQRTAVILNRRRVARIQVKRGLRSLRSRAWALASAACICLAVTWVIWSKA